SSSVASTFGTIIKNVKNRNRQKTPTFFSTHFFKISFIKLNVPTSLTNQRNNADQSLTFGKDNLEKKEEKIGKLLYFFSLN
ncbi:hypothetical protein, partial [Enterococcus faecalis]|uniref:hypothetical protein n=1 Tax=Enterococcus faecalis TaxID=1351 RepID=UPI001A94DE3B